MHRASVLSVLALALTGCGGDEPAGEPLIASTLVGDYDGTAFTPEYGFARETTNGIEMYVGTTKISCADDFMSAPRPGTFVTTGASTAAVGSYPAFFHFVRVVDMDLTGGGSTGGTVAVTSLTETEAVATLTYDASPAMTHYALNGSATLLRCP